MKGVRGQSVSGSLTSAAYSIDDGWTGPHLRQACVPSMRSVASGNNLSIRAGDTKRREEDGAMPDTASPSPLPPLLQSFDDPLGRKIIELHVWAVREGLRGTDAAALFDGLCRRLVDAGVPLWRGFAGMRTLHPQWGGYGYIWWRHLNAIQPRQFERGDTYEQNILNSPIGELIREAEAFAGRGTPWRDLRRRLAGPEAQLDFPDLDHLAAAGATVYFAEIVRFGETDDPSRGTGIGYSFATDRPEGFSDDDLVLLKAVLPVVSLAMMAHAGHTIASGLLEAYLGADAGRR